MHESRGGAFILKRTKNTTTRDRSVDVVRAMRERERVSERAVVDGWAVAGERGTVCNSGQSSVTCNPLGGGSSQ
jgi:hypothetical protein